LGARARLAVLVGKAAAASSRAARRGAGANLAGHIAARLAPGLLATLAAGRRVVVVSGTNGKTTTTRMLAVALRTEGPLLTNGDGSNLARGVLGCLMTDPSRTLTRCVFEVDELALDEVARAVHPELFVLSNLSRDQLDRMTEVRVLVRRWQQVLQRAAAEAAETRRPPPTVVANADDPMVAAAVVTGPSNEPVLPVIWVSAGQPWIADASSCPRCSAHWVFHTRYACDTCGFARPEPTWHMAGDVLQGPDGVEHHANLLLPGRANRANALMAVAAAAHLGVAPEAALSPIRALDAVGGRYALVQVQGVAVRLLLAKNPAGWKEMLAPDMAASPSGELAPLVLALNAGGPDGKDTSWIWDVPFDQLSGRAIYASGERAEDLAVRLRYAEVDHAMTRDPLRAVTLLAASASAERIDLVANYTAFTSICSRLGVA
jgi:UDP-N-acetylmuramyl tripeptide synthase